MKLQEKIRFLKFNVNKPDHKTLKTRHSIEVYYNKLGLKICENKDTEMLWK